MSEKQGFQNCPLIKEFKVGMDISFNGWNRTVVFVGEKGALTLHRFAQISPLWVTPEQISSCELDLDSVWEGRPCWNTKIDHEARIIFSNSEIIAYVEDGAYHCMNPECFWPEHKWLPLFPPEQPWRPLKGAKVLFGKDAVEVLAVWGDMAWIPRGGTAETVGINELRPLPAESPVKNCPHCGMEGAVHSNSVGSEWYVRCPNDCALSANNRNEAIRRWNQRTIPADPKAEGE